jgi:hypothetical protein
MEMRRGPRDVWRVVRLAAVIAFVASAWACYRTTMVPGSEVERLRALTVEPKVTLRNGTDTIVIDRATELTLHTVRGAAYEVTPSLLSYSPSAMKLGPSSDPRALVVPYREIEKLGVKELSIGRTLGLVLPLAGAAVYVGLMVLICGFGC